MLWVKALLGALGIGGDYLAAKSKLKQTEVEAKTRIVEKSADHISNWEVIHAQGSQTSWKDEFWTVLLAIPLIMCFIPGRLAFATAGFAALATLPTWYTYTLVTVILAAFGIRNKDAIAGIFKNPLKKT